MNSVLQNFCSKVAGLGWNIFFKGAFDSKKSKKPTGFISLENGQPIPIFEGESKKEATENFVNKKESEKSSLNTQKQELEQKDKSATIKKLYNAVKAWKEAHEKKDEKASGKALEKLFDLQQEGVAMGALPEGTSVVDVIKQDFFDQYKDDLSKHQDVAENPEQKYTDSDDEQGPLAKAASSPSVAGSQLSFSYQGAIDDSDEEKLEAATYPGSLTGKQEDAIRDYTGNGYEKINTALRTKDKKLMEETEEARKHLDDVFTEASVYKPLVVYRGMDLDRDIPWVDALMENNLKERACITEKGYLSTTASRYIAEKDFSGGILIKITTPRGAQGVSVDKLSQHGEEKEILFNRGYKLKISRINKVDNGDGVVSYEIDAVLKK